MFGSRSQVQMTRSGGIADSPGAGGWLSALSINGLIGGATVFLWLVLVLPEATGVMHLLRVLSPFNLVLLAGAAVILLFQGCRSDWEFSLTPTFQGVPLLMLLGTAIATLLARAFLDLEHLSVVVVIVGAYGLVGLFCDAQTWKRGLPFVGAFAILLFLFALELTDLGHLARTAMAETVELLLQPLGVGAISSEDILVLSTGIAFVDVPCSGFKNIEIGSLFFMAASLLERKRMGLRWLLVGLSNLALLIMANIARILVIVVLTFVLQQRTLAEILHVPLGLCGFVTACLLTLQLLRWVPRQAAADCAYSPVPIPPLVNLRNAVITLGLLLGLALIPQPAAVSAVTLNPLQWPLSLHTQAIDLTPQEQTFFTRHPGTVAEKQTFEFQGLSGSMIVVTSPTWQAHHAPELCLSASGFQLDQMQKRSLADDVTGRWLSLNQGQRQAAYWFQSAQHTTDDYLDRVWREITRQDPQWTMVSILFDQASADSADVKTMLEGVHGAIATAMTSEQI
jgi:exosortase O